MPRRRPTGYGRPAYVPNIGDSDYAAFDTARDTGGAANKTIWDKVAQKERGAGTRAMTGKINTGTIPDGGVSIAGDHYLNGEKQ